jgi:hypothetical protein
VIVGEQNEAFPIGQNRISRSVRPSNKPLDLSTMHGDERSGFFQGWTVVGAAFALLTMSAGITYSTPVMFVFF